MADHEIAPQDGAIDYAAGREFVREDEDFEALLDSHLTTRRCNSRSPSPQLSRREQEQLRAQQERVARGLADDAPPNPQPAFCPDPAFRRSEVRRNSLKRKRSDSCQRAAGDEPGNAASDSDGAPVRHPVADLDPAPAPASAHGSGPSIPPSSATCVSLADLASAGKAVPGSKVELQYIAASVATAAAELRGALGRPTPIAQPATRSGDGGGDGRGLVAFKVRPTTKLKPERVPQILETKASEPTLAEGCSGTIDPAAAAERKPSAATGADTGNRTSKKSRWGGVTARAPATSATVAAAPESAAPATAHITQPTAAHPTTTQPTITHPTTTQPAASLPPILGAAPGAAREAELRALALKRMVERRQQQQQQQEQQEQQEQQQEQQQQHFEYRRQ